MQYSTPLTHYNTASMLGVVSLVCNAVALKQCCVALTQRLSPLKLSYITLIFPINVSMRNILSLMQSAPSSMASVFSSTQDSKSLKQDNIASMLSNTSFNLTSNILQSNV